MPVYAIMKHIWYSRKVYGFHIYHMGPTRTTGAFRDNFTDSTPPPNDCFTVIRADNCREIRPNSMQPRNVNSQKFVSGYVTA